MKYLRLKATYASPTKIVHAREVGEFDDDEAARLLEKTPDGGPWATVATKREWEEQLKKKTVGSGPQHTI